MQSTAEAQADASPSPGETWEARLADLDSRLRAWRRGFEVELGRVLRERKLRGLFRKPSPEALRSAEEEARRRAGDSILAELSTFFDEICDLYAKSLPQERAKIRARIGSAEEVFALYWSYVEGVPARVRRREDGPHLLRGLLAVVIDDLRTELQLVNAVLGRLLVAAESAGLDWRPILAEAAKLANPGTGGGGACMRGHLEEFPNSDYFRRSLSSRLREAGRKAATGTG